MDEQCFWIEYRNQNPHDMDINNYFYELPFEMKNQGTCLSNEASMNMTTPSVVWYLFCLVPVCIDQ